MTGDRFTRDKATIRAELERRARARLTITYGEAAGMVGRTAHGLRRILGTIKVEEIAHHRPDLGCLVVTARTGLPSQVRCGDQAQKRAVAAQEAVFAAWAAK